MDIPVKIQGLKSTDKNSREIFVKGYKSIWKNVIYKFLYGRIM